MNDRDVQAALNRWISSVTGLTTIAAYGGIDAPNRPYISTQRATSDNVRDRAQRVHYEIDEAEVSSVQVSSELSWTYLVFCYAEEPSAPLNRLRAAAEVPQVAATLHENLALREVGVINDIPEKVEAEWEPRAQVNVTVHGSNVEAFDVDIITQSSPTVIEEVED